MDAVAGVGSLEVARGSLYHLLRVHIVSEFLQSLYMLNILSVLKLPHICIAEISGESILSSVQLEVSNFRLIRIMDLIVILSSCLHGR